MRKSDFVFRYRVRNWLTGFPLLDEPLCFGNFEDMSPMDAGLLTITAGIGAAILGKGVGLFRADASL